MTRKPRSVDNAEAQQAAEQIAIAFAKLEAAYRELTIVTDKAMAVLEKGFCKYSADYEAEIRRWIASRKAAKR